MNYDCLILGSGHAGIEAAFAFANQKMHVGLITFDEKLIANMPCNPSIGGPAKGVVTREIDSLGGMQGIAADHCMIQIKLLNLSKGAGVQALRAQIDKVKYHEYFKNLILKNKFIHLIKGVAKRLIIEDKKIMGMIINDEEYFSKTVIIASGTFLDSKIFIGKKVINQGPDGFQTNSELSKNLQELGFSLIRLKTGTPPRIHKDSIDYSLCELDSENNEKICFSNAENNYLPLTKQVNCWLTHTTKETHKIIENNLELSPMYGGSVKGVGPRYCPSIEDKIVRFNDKERHQIFIEPESRSLDSMYLAGISTSLPENIQDEILKSIPSLRNAKVIKYAYAIEYDAINPNQLKHSLESKTIENLFFAGQINGTSGYEEAAAQGLIAGINAANKIKKISPFIPSRTSSYIGVLIDDIVTKEITDPYRLLTSRCEYRLLIRNDNTDDRLINDGFINGLISKKRHELYLENLRKFELNILVLKKTNANNIKDLKNNFRKSNMTVYELLKTQNFDYQSIEKFLKLEKMNDTWKNKINIAIKYEGYINAQKKIINNYQKLWNIKLSNIINYQIIPNISLEAIDKLNKIKPENLGQITKIGGISMNDIINIKLFIDKGKK